MVRPPPPLHATRVPPSYHPRTTLISPSYRRRTTPPYHSAVAYRHVPPTYCARAALVPPTDHPRTTHHPSLTPQCIASRATIRHGVAFRASLSCRAGVAAEPRVCGQTVVRGKKMTSNFIIFGRKHMFKLDSTPTHPHTHHPTTLPSTTLTPTHAVCSAHLLCLVPVTVRCLVCRCGSIGCQFWC